jgi:hypothetical protein
LAVSHTASIALKSAFRERLHRHQRAHAPTARKGEPTVPTLVEKIAAACKDVAAVKVEGNEIEFPYLRILDLAHELRGRLFSQGIVIVADDLSIETSERDSEIPGRWWTNAVVKCKFTATDGSDSLAGQAYGYGRDMDGFAVSLAQTYALKSWLKRLSLTFGERDDSEYLQGDEPGYQGFGVKLDEMQSKHGTDVCEWPMTRRDVLAFNAVCRNYGISESKKKTFLEMTFDVSVPSDLKRKHTAETFEWAHKTGKEQQKQEIAEDVEPS